MTDEGLVERPTSSSRFRRVTSINRRRHVALPLAESPTYTIRAETTKASSVSSPPAVDHRASISQFANETMRCADELNKYMIVTARSQSVLFMSLKFIILTVALNELVPVCTNSG